MTRAADLTGRLFVTAALALGAIYILLGAWMLCTRWPLAGALIATHALCILGPGRLLRDRLRTIALDVCDMLGLELDARKDAEHRQDHNFLRLSDAIERRRQEHRTPLALPASTEDRAS
jgi:hypothetical protein